MGFGHKSHHLMDCTEPPTTSTGSCPLKVIQDSSATQDVTVYIVKVITLGPFGGAEEGPEESCSVCLASPDSPRGRPVDLDLACGAPPEPAEPPLRFVTALGGACRSGLACLVRASSCDLSPEASAAMAT